MPAPRVGQAATTSTDKTSPRVVKSTRYVHQRRTRNNNPMPSIEEEGDNVDNATKSADSVQATSRRASLRSHRGRTLQENTAPRKSRRVNGVIIGSRRNNAQKASRKRIQKLIDQQTEHDEALLTQMQQHFARDGTPTIAPAEIPTTAVECQPGVPTTSPPERPMTSPIPSVTQEDEPAMNNVQTQPTYYMDQEGLIHVSPAERSPDDVYISPSRPTFRSPNKAMFVTQEALHFVLGKSMLSDFPGQDAEIL